MTLSIYEHDGIVPRGVILVVAPPNRAALGAVRRRSSDPVAFVIDRLRPSNRRLARVQFVAERPGARCTRALHDRQRDGTERLIHHSDRGVQYLSIRYTEFMAAAGIEASVGSKGDSYDNALAESVIGLHKTEEIYRRGPWKGVEDVAFATLEWVAWYNTRRLLEPLGYVSPGRVRAGLLPSPVGFG